ncbi:NAD-dependent epimerase/dehydratase family protein [Mycobacterium sp. SMC-4]|uniref:NAD-dependent epimerase/dehydratase family protein n=1 Tax=Mycobacterium sp. SMC-4 TaxID=2857059 RepID=UPI003D061BB6
MSRKVALVTGSAGFIGFHVCKELLTRGYRVVGLDALTDYYDVNLKLGRQAILLENDSFTALNNRLEEKDLLSDVFAAEEPDIVVHLAAQAGVRYSIESPRTYLESNIIGTFELLEAARLHPPQHMLLASTSSAYGASKDMPYVESARADHQMSFYAATKKATENLAHSYAHLFGLPITVFRFFTVYGPWGRPDMALFKFTQAVLDGLPIDVYNYGDMKRDFTYIDDVVRAIALLMECVPSHSGERVSGDSLSPVAPYRLVNIGNSEPVQLTEFIRAIEQATAMPAISNLMPMQAGDVPATWADTTLLSALTGYRPATNITDGVAKFVDWYRDFYNC